MRINNLTNGEIKAILINMLIFMGYQNDHPDIEYSWWDKDSPNNVYEMIQVNVLMDNNVAMQYFLLRVAKKIGLFKIELFSKWYTVSFGGESCLNKATTLSEALFLSINDYINKK